MLRVVCAVYSSACLLPGPEAGAQETTVVSEQDGAAQVHAAYGLTFAIAPAKLNPNRSVIILDRSAVCSPTYGIELAGEGRAQAPGHGGREPARRVEQELIVEALYSYGNYKIFASGYDDKLFDAGLEYDRHSWGRFLKAQVDYVAEVLPFVLLDKPLHTDQWGNPVPKKDKNIRELVPGVGIAPLGFRLQWRSNSRIRPYLEAKGGMLGFAKKVPAMQATYENFSLQSAMGAQLKVNDRWGLRLGLFSDFHFSNAFIVSSNPGLDVMNANLGISYHF